VEASARSTRRVLVFGLLLGSLVSLVIAGVASGAPGDATATQVADIRSPGESVPAGLFNAGGTLLFAAANGVDGDELWKSNGGPLGPGGTEMVANINPGSQGSGPTNFANVNDTVFFSADDGTSVAPGFHGREMWKIEPPYTTPVLVEDINATGFGASSAPEQFTNVNGTVFFVANDGITGDEVWKSVSPYDAASTSQVEDINQNPTSAASSFPDQLTNVNGTLFFAADDGASGTELWKSTDGTAAGTNRVEDINPTALVSSNPDDLTNVNGTLLFRASDGAANGEEPWKSAGPGYDMASTEVVENIAPLGADSNPAELTNVNGTLFFRADDGANGNELWKSQSPFVPGTTDLIDVNNTGMGSSSDPAGLAGIGGILYFRAGDGMNGIELWRSDGGPVNAGTNLVANINPVGNSTPASITGVGGQVFFRANNGVVGDELWKSTGSGATLVRDINPMMGVSSSPDALTDVNGTLFFRATDGVTGRELWKATIEGPAAPVIPTIPVTPAVPATPTQTKKKCKKKKGKKGAAAAKKCKKKR
jgi:ELWxxDGT repeat protein